MNPRRVDSVILYVEDLERAIAFYTDRLGLELKLRGDGYAEFLTEGTKFGMFERAKLPELIGRDAVGPGPDGEVLFIVDDVDAEVDRLLSTGATVLSGPTERPWGHRTAHLADPDGHVVELAQEIPRTDRS